MSLNARAGSSLLLAGAIALSTSSCCLRRNSQARYRSRLSADAVLVAARDHQISMFGDLPGAPEPTFVGRASTSLRQHTFTEVGADFDVALDGRGERIVFASTRHHTQPDLYFKAVSGVAVTQLTSDPSSDIQPALSQDGRRVAFASNRGGGWDIWVVGIEGGPPIQITHGPSEDLHPSWSPDGRQLVYCSLPADGGQWELWIADADTGASRRFIGYGLFPEWSSKGDQIVYQRARERGGRWFSIWSITLINGEPRYPTELAASASHAMILPTFNRDASRIAYVTTPLSDATGSARVDDDLRGGVPPFDLWVMQADGAAKMRLTDGQAFHHAPAFAPDGRIFFTCDRSGHENIWSVSPIDPPALIFQDASSANAGNEPARTRATSATLANRPATQDDL